MQLEGYSPTYTELLKIFYLVSKKHVFLSKKIKQALFSYKTATLVTHFVRCEVTKVAVSDNKRNYIMFLMSQNRPFIRYINGNHIERTI